MRIALLCRSDYDEPNMDINRIRTKVLSGHYAVDEHALIEGLKDGILVDDMVYAILHGKIIVHVVVE